MATGAVDEVGVEAGVVFVFDFFTVFFFGTERVSSFSEFFFSSSRSDASVSFSACAMWRATAGALRDESGVELYREARIGCGGVTGLGTVAAGTWIDGVTSTAGSGAGGTGGVEGIGRGTG